MVIKSDASDDVYKFYLPPNISNAKERYDKFLVPTTEFIDCPVGFYTYSIYQSETDSSTDESGLGEPVETGKLKIIGEDSFIEIITPITTNEYIIYK